MFSKQGIEICHFSVGDEFKVRDYVQLMFLWGMLVETAADRRAISVSCNFESLSWIQKIYLAKATTGGRVSQYAANQTHGLSHQQQERSSSFQSKWSLQKEAVSF